MTTRPTDAERAQARAEHLDAIADCFEPTSNDGKPAVQAFLVSLGVRLWQTPAFYLADLDEARAIRDRLAELIEDAEAGGGL